MPNEITNYYRSLHPEDTRSDDEITSQYLEDHPLETFKDYPDFLKDAQRILAAQDAAIRKATAPSLGGEFKRGLERGTKELEANAGYGTLALAGRGLSKIAPETGKALEDYALAKSAEKQQEAQEYPATIQSFGDVNGPSDALRYAAGVTGSSLPGFIPPAVGTVVGGALGGPVGAALGANVGNAGTAAALATAGAGVGAFLPSAAETQNYAQLREMPNVNPDDAALAALGTGAVGGLLNIPPVAKFAGTFSKAAESLAPRLIPLKVLDPVLAKLPDNEVAQYFGRVLRAVPEQAVLQGGIGGLQELTSMAGELYVNRANPDFRITPEQVRARLENAGVSGAILGGALGPIEAIPKSKHGAETKNNEEPAPAAQQPPEPQPQPPVAEPVAQPTTAPTAEPLAPSTAEAAPAGSAVGDQLSQALAAGGSSGQPDQDEVARRILAAREQGAALPPEGDVLSQVLRQIEQRRQGTTVPLPMDVAPPPVSVSTLASTIQDSLSQVAAREAAERAMLPPSQENIGPFNDPNYLPESILSGQPRPLGEATQERNLPTNEEEKRRQEEGLLIQAQTQPGVESSSLPARNDLSAPGKAGAASVVGEPPPSLTQSTAAKVAEAAAQVNTNPTEAQKAAGNYQKGHVTIQGLPISIENPAGSIRAGRDANGNEWSVRMPVDYGYIKRTEGKDGDHVDVFIGPSPESDRVYVVDQRNTATGKFDEHKALIGFPTRDAALAAYDGSFSDGRGPERRSAVAETTMGRFKEWLRNGDQTKPFTEAETVQRYGITPPERVDALMKSVDFDNSALSKIKTKRGTTTEKSGLKGVKTRGVGKAEERISEPSFFTETRTEYSPELAERLVADAEGTQTTKSRTRRVTFFEDNETGEVIGLPTWYTSDKSRGGKIYRVASPEGGKGTRLETLMKEGRYAPVASVRLNEEVSGTDPANTWRFADYEDFQNRFANEAGTIMDATARYSEAMPLHMQAQGFDEEGNVLEKLAPENGKTPEEHIQDFRSAIAEELFRSRDLTPNGLRDAIVSAGSENENIPGFRAATLLLLREDPELAEKLRVMDAQDAQKLIVEQLTKAIYEGKIPELAQGQPAIGRGSPSAERLLLSVRSELRGDGRPTGEAVASRFARVQESFREAGGSIDIVRAVGQEIGSFRGKERKITLALNDAENPTIDNLRLLLHEVAHSISIGLPEYIREALHRSVDSVAEKLIAASNDPRLQNRELTGAILSEELFATAMELHGIERPASQGFAAQIVRFVKALYYRTALALQKIFGRPVSPELAMAYVKNRFDALTAGDTRKGIYRFLIPPALANLKRDPDALPDALYSTRGSGVGIVDKIGDRIDPRVPVEKNIAAFNEQVDFEKELERNLAGSPAVLEAARDAELTPLEWWRRIVRIEDPTKLIEAEQQRVDPTTNLVVTSNPETRIASLADTQGNRAEAALMALRRANKQFSDVKAFARKAREDAEQLENKREGIAARYDRENETPKLPLDTKSEERRQSRIADLKAQAQALAKERDKAQAMADAASHFEGLYAKRVNDLKGLNQVHDVFYLAHGAQILVPEKGPEGAELFKPMTIQMDSRKGEITAKSEVQAAADKMTVWLDERKQSGRMDGTYYNILAMRNELQTHFFDASARDTTGRVTTLMLDSLSEQLKAFGTPLFRQLSAMVNNFGGKAAHLRRVLFTPALEVERAGSAGAKFLGVSPEFYDHNFVNPAKHFIELSADIAERHPNDKGARMTEAMSRLRKEFLTDPETAARLKGREDQFFTLLRKDLEVNGAIADWLVKNNVLHDVNVRDETLGENVERQYIERGVQMFPRRISNAFEQVWKALADRRNWAAANETFDGVGDAYGTDEWQSRAAQIEGLFADPTVQDEFFRAMVYDVPIFSRFKAPVFEDGVTQPEANPAFARQAYEAAGPDGQKSVLTFLQNLYALHKGKTPLGRFVEDNLKVFAQQFGEMRRLAEQMDPQSAKLPKDWKNLVPGFMVNAREIMHWPTNLTEYVRIDTRMLPRIVERVAAQQAFGINQERLEGTYKSAWAELQQRLQPLRAAQAWVDAHEPSRKRKDRERAMAKFVGGPDELKKLKKLQEMGKFLDEVRGFKGQLIQYFNGRYASFRTPGFLQNLTGIFSTFMLNQPGSALGQFADVFGPTLAFGTSSSTIRASLRNASGAIKEIAGGLAYGLGVDLKRNDRFWGRMQTLGMIDPESARKLSDLANETHSPSDSRMTRVTDFLRKTREAVTMSARGGPVVGFRPFGLFNQANIIVHAIGTKHFFETVQDHVMRAVEWMRDNPAEVTPDLADLKMGEWADLLGLKGSEKDGFTKIFQRALDDWAVDFHQLAREAARNIENGREVLSDKTLVKLQGMWIKEISSEANLSTMNAAAFNNSVLRFMLPLLGWGVRRSLMVARLGQDAEGKFGYEALARGLTGLALMGGGGLAISALIDEYNEDLLNKRRNLRRLNPIDQDAGNWAMALLEHSARVGTFGLLGDLANEMVNVGTGQGANRGLSLDSRVVFVNSAMGMIHGISNLINQGGTVDYANVVRPFLFSMGGNGALQYLQMANTIFGLDNAEARANSRTNVGNWLRVVGRETGLEVRTSQGGYSSPTPMTPFITRMQLAALADNNSDFMDAYRDALTEARNAGNADPADVVRKAFASRHPLKAVFRDEPTIQQIQRILAAMPEEGRLDVSEAIRLFNRYSATIGARPFEGKQQETSFRPPKLDFGTQVMRARASLF